MKLALGTVQFGLAYGAFNPDGRPPVETVRAVLARAAAAGIDLLDTARAYGESEAVLGGLEAGKRFAIVTKLTALGEVEGPLKAAERSLMSSLAALRVQRVAGLLFHSAPDLLGPHGDALWAFAEAARQAGKADRIGVSVYSAAEAETLAARYPLQLIQLPFNVFDQQAVQSGALARLRQRGVEVHVRSALLQGFAVADPGHLPPHLAPHARRLRHFHALAEAAGLSPLEAAVGFVLAQEGVDRAVMGVLDTAQLDDILAAAATRVDPAAFADVGCDDPDLVDPRRWARAA